MNPWIAVLRALPTTFVIYVSAALLAAMQAFPTAFALSRIHVLPLDNSAIGIAGVESLLRLLPVFSGQGMAFAIAALGYALLSPWLQMAWLSALAEPKGPRAALSEGARLTPRAYLTSLCVGVGCTLLLAPWVALAWWLHGWLATRAHVRVQDIATALALLPCLPLAVVGFTWHDLARARSLTTGGVRSALSSLRDAWRPLTWGRFTLWTVFGWALVFAAQAYAFSQPSRHGMAALVTVATVQGAALARSVIRSRWLTEALLLVDQPSVRASRARKESR